MHIVVDCNVLIAAGLTDGACRAVIRTVLQRHTPILSVAIEDEYRSVIARPKFRASHAGLTAITDILCHAAIYVVPEACPWHLPDPDDEIYLAAALAGSCPILITGNTKDFGATDYGSVRIVSPRTFLGLTQ